jgi:hypothetical protein
MHTISNQHRKELFKSSPDRSEFQTNYVKQIADMPHFDFFCGNPMCDEPYKGPFALIYYTKDGTLHLEWSNSNQGVQVHDLWRS